MASASTVPPNIRDPVKVREGGWGTRNALTCIPDGRGEGVHLELLYIFPQRVRVWSPKQQV
eukprot:759633-Hanusia_phi.AAC.2